MCTHSLLGVLILSNTRNQELQGTTTQGRHNFAESYIALTVLGPSLEFVPELHTDQSPSFLARVYLKDVVLQSHILASS